MDPANPQRPSVESREITRVRQWVLSVLVGTTILHLSAGLAIAGVFADDSRPGAGVGLNVLSAMCGVAAVARGPADPPAPAALVVAAARPGPRAGRAVVRAALNELSRRRPGTA